MTGRAVLLAVARSPIGSARVAAWSWSEVRRLAGTLHAGGMEALGEIRPSPAAPAWHRPTVAAALRLAGATCLERAAILQRWDADHDRPRDLVVGVARETDGCVGAHAWLDGDDDGTGYVELHRHLPG